MSPFSEGDICPNDDEILHLIINPNFHSVFPRARYFTVYSAMRIQYTPLLRSTLVLIPIGFCLLGRTHACVIS